MANQRQYLDFYLQLRDLDQKAGTFKVAVLPSPAVGESRKSITVPYHPDELAPYLQKLERRLIDQEHLSQLGERLAAMLLPPGEIRQLFEQALGLAGQDGGVRLRIMTHEPELAQLPWEYTYLPIYAKGANDYRHFLVLNPQISLVRHEPIAKQHPKVEGSSPEKLKLLAAMANPQGDLNLETEKQNLTQVLEGFQVDGVTFEWQPVLEGTTQQDLMTALMKKPELFYFAGHGQFEQEGYIQLAGPTPGSAYLMPATELALKLKQAGVRVAMFGTCESARRDGTSEWAGIAPTLVAEGVPVVVAMQYPVLDKHAIAFSNAFYIALAAGLSVDEAVASGRLAMIGPDASKQRKLSAEPEDDGGGASTVPANVQWGIPVLYMRSADSVIFPREESPKADELRALIEQTVKSSLAEQDEFVTGFADIRVKQSVKKLDGGSMTGVDRTGVAPDNKSVAVKQEVEEANNANIIGYRG
jgi:hypothetical protein